jgi:hypothetical protein
MLPEFTKKVPRIPRDCSIDNTWYWLSISSSNSSETTVDADADAARLLGVVTVRARSGTSANDAAARVRTMFFQLREMTNVFRETRDRREFASTRAITREFAIGLELRAQRLV